MARCLHASVGTPRNSASRGNLSQTAQRLKYCCAGSGFCRPLKVVLMYQKTPSLNRDGCAGLKNEKWFLRLAATLACHQPMRIPVTAITRAWLVGFHCVTFTSRHRVHCATLMPSLSCRQGLCNNPRNRSTAPLPGKALRRQIVLTSCFRFIIESRA